MFQLKVVISDEIDELFELPALYRTAREALELMMDRRFHSGNVCTVAQLRTPLLLKELEGRSDLIAKEIRELAAHDKKKDTQYCETLYHYLEDLRCPFYPSKYGALPYPQNRGRFCHSFG